MKFEWDTQKYADNLEKHGVDFIEAILIFENPVLERIDSRKDYGEIRYQAVGVADDECFSIIYTWRGDNRRIISAWRLGKDGKRKYYDYIARASKET